MSDLTDYFDTEINTPKLKRVIDKLNGKLAESQSDIERLKAELKGCKSELASVKKISRGKDSLIDKRNKIITKLRGLDKIVTRTSMARDKIAEIKKEGCTETVKAITKRIAMFYFLSDKTVYCLWYGKYESQK